MNRKLESFEHFPGTQSFDSGAAQKKGAVENRRIKRVLGIDPGLANTGFGVVDFFQNRYRLVFYGCVETSSAEKKGVRLLKIASRLQAVIDEYRPSSASMEALFFAKNVTSAIPVAEAKGVCAFILAQNCVELSEYKPNQIKLSVTGTAKADKKLVQQYVKILLGMECEPKPDHAADALACAITHLHNSSIIL